MENKEMLAWVLIIIPALYLGYFAFKSSAWLSLVVVIVWLMGDYLLSQS